MQKGSSLSDPRWRVLFLTGVAAFVAVMVLVTVASMSARVDPTPAQDVIRLETRINQLEQRLYTMEASIRNIEQQTRIANTTSRSGGVTANDLSQLIAQLQTLQVRVMEDECALAKLDERTLTPAMRDARRKSGAAADPCRANAEAPLRLPERRE
jgi:flagellar biosynthesis chaperone FliJ